MAQGRRVAGALMLISLLLILSQSYQIMIAKIIGLKILDYMPGYHKRLVIANHGPKRKFLKSP